jgi:predicted TIM-barrel fold metal-dependent hydrolase
LSAAYRIGTAGREASAAMAGMLLRHYGPTRLMWGSDWPHTRFERLADYSASRSDLDVWIPDSADRACVLAQTPAALFGFLRTT